MERQSKFDFSRLAKKWPSPIVARSEVKHFSGGIISGKSLANLNSLGKGPRPIKIGHRVAYDAEELANWIYDFFRLRSL